MQINWQKKAIALHSELGTPTLFRELHPDLNICTPDSAIAIACSGGADSLAVLLLTWARFPELRKRLCVLHFDHAVREESADDAEFVRNVCRNLGIEFTCECRTPEGNAHSEASLRAERLDFFAREMRSRNIKTLIQGHQKDDIAETLLMRLTRGAGTDGLAAPRKISVQRDGRIFVRPLLEISKKEILAALRACEIPWKEDLTNAGTDYFRNRVRNRVLPELRAAAPFENIARSRKLAEEDADALDFLAEKILRETMHPSQTQTEEKVRKENSGDSKLCAAQISHAYKFFAKGASELESPVRLPALSRRVVRKIFAGAGIKTDGAAVVDALVEAICAGTPKKMQIGTHEVIWTGTDLFLGEAEQTNSSTLAQITGNNNSFLFSSEKIIITDELFARICDGTFSPDKTVFLAGTPEIFVRNLLPGEKFRPLGSPGEKSVLRIFTDKKIPPSLRKNLPVFADGTGIAWIPGLPPAERFRIRAAGTTALRLTYRREALPL